MCLRLGFKTCETVKVVVVELQMLHYRASLLAQILGARSTLTNLLYGCVEVAEESVLGKCLSLEPSRNDFVCPSCLPHNAKKSICQAFNSLRCAKNHSIRLLIWGQGPRAKKSASKAAHASHAYHSRMLLSETGQEKYKKDIQSDDLSLLTIVHVIALTDLCQEGGRNAE